MGDSDMVDIEALKARTGEKWFKAVDMAKKGASTRDIIKETGVSRTYAWEAQQLAKAEVLAKAPPAPLPSEIKVTEKVIEKPPITEAPAPPAKPPEAPPTEVTPPEEEIEIIPDEEDCKDLYAIPFETMALLLQDDELEVSEARIEKQGKRLHKLFQKYKWKLPLLEIMFLQGLAVDIGSKGMHLWEKRKKAKEEEKKKLETGKTPSESVTREPQGSTGTAYSEKQRPPA